MANLTIQSKYRMLSGHEIPVLGYGVWLLYSNNCHYVLPFVFLIREIHGIPLHLSKCKALLLIGLFDVNYVVVLKLTA